MMPKLVVMTGLGMLCILKWKGKFTYEAQYAKNCNWSFNDQYVDWLF